MPHNPPDGPAANANAFDDCRDIRVADAFLTPAEAAGYLKCSKSFLDKARVYGGGPNFIRLGARKITYRRSALDAWADARSYASTSQYNDK